MGAIPGSVAVTGFIAPTDSTDTYPVTDPIWGIDSLRSLATVALRNTIPAGLRREGMVVYTSDAQTYWSLLPAPWTFTNSDWSVFQTATFNNPSIILGLTTTNLSSPGLFGYVSANSTIDLTDSTNLFSSILAGVSNSISGQLVISGLIATAQMTVIGGQPGPGSPVYLAASTDEASAAGKLTATAPTVNGTVVAEVGICLDNSNYAGSKTAVVLIQVKAPIQL